MNYLDLFKSTLDAVECTNGRDAVYSYQECIQKICDLCTESRSGGNVLFFIGNGGSAGIASHMATDFMKNGRLKTQTFYDPTLLTCMGNDYSFAEIFAQPFRMMAKPGDSLVAISSSGDSSNILNTVKAAQEKNCRVITFSGFKPENRLRKLGQINIYVPLAQYGIVESIHNLILQQVVDELMAAREGVD